MWDWIGWMQNVMRRKRGLVSSLASKRLTRVARTDVARAHDNLPDNLRLADTRVPHHALPRNEPSKGAGIEQRIPVVVRRDRRRVCRRVNHRKYVALSLKRRQQLARETIREDMASQGLAVVGVELRACCAMGGSREGGRGSMRQSQERSEARATPHGRARDEERRATDAGAPDHHFVRGEARSDGCVRCDAKFQISSPLICFALFCALIILCSDLYPPPLPPTHTYQHTTHLSPAMQRLTSCHTTTPLA